MTPNHTAQEYIDWITSQECITIEGPGEGELYEDEDGVEVCDKDDCKWEGIGDSGLWEDGDTLQELLDTLIETDERELS